MAAGLGGPVGKLVHEELALQLKLSKVKLTFFQRYAPLTKVKLSDACAATFFTQLQPFFRLEIKPGQKLRRSLSHSILQGHLWPPN